jgi:hypothetical protein
MTLDKEHIDYENYCRQLIGLTIASVEYSEVKYSETDPKPWYKTQFADLDSVDNSITLITADNKKIEIYWDGKFFQYGIGVKIDGDLNFSAFQKWNVSNNDLWKKYIGTKITDVKLTWEMVTTTEEKPLKTYHFIYPQDIKISFSNGKSIFISASGFLNPGDNEVFGMLDNLTVTDNEILARQVKMIA